MKYCNLKKLIVKNIKNYLHDKGSKLSYSPIIYIAEYIIVIQYIETSVKSSRKQMDHLFHFETWNYSVSFALRRCHSLYHSLSHVVIRWTTRCSSLYHSLSFVVARCIARLLFCKQLFNGSNLPVTSILKQLLESILESAWNYKNKREHGIEVD